MTHLSEASGGDTATGTGTLAGALLGRFEALVSPTVVGAADRASQGRTIGALVAVGLVAALLSPFAGLGELGMWTVVLPTIVAGACLALAGLLASSGRLDLVLGLSIAAYGAAAAALGVHAGGLASPFLLVLLVPSLEALAAGRRSLAAFAAGVACVALGSVAFAEWLGFAAVRLRFDAPVVAGLGLAYGVSLMLRGRALVRAARERRVADDVEAGLVEAALSDAVLRFSPDGRLLAASTAAGSLFGITAGDGTELFQRLHVTDRVSYLKAFGDLRAGTPRRIAELRIKAPEGRDEGFLTLAMQFIAVREPASARAGGTEGRLCAILCVARDVTAERMLTAELRAALAEANRGSDAKSHFLASISHELRTPLNAIIGFSDVLDQEFFGSFENPRQKEYVGLIRQSGEHLLSVVNGLLDISKIEAGRYELALEPFAIHDAAMAAADTMRPEAERKGLTLDVSLRSRGAEIVADRRACHQILLNLLSNAVKFTDRGSIRLEAEIVGDRLCLRVTDTGIGIEPAELARLGTPFTQVSTGLARRHQGTGLGLSLVKGLSELHFGSMAIASEFGRGTAVTVTIPLDCATRIAEQQSSNENVVALAHARKKTHPLPHDLPAPDVRVAAAGPDAGLAARRKA